ncbi:shikimate kinase [Spirochaetia bacterium]|nr:shikimate kinase [Spirochaetia bacterium]
MGFIVVTGPKHSGKTTVGRELARRLSSPFFDLDRLIEERSGKSPRILYKTGPDIFRREEEAALAALLEDTSCPLGVIAAGGGIADNPAAMALLRAAAKPGTAKLIIVYLDVSAGTAWQRISGAGELPPFLQAESPELSQEKHRLLHQRRAKIYREAAAFTVSAEGKNPLEISGELCGLIEKIS